MSGTTGAAGGAAPGGAPYGSVPQPPAEHPAASTSLMSAVGGGGGYGAPQPPTQPPGGPAAGGFSTPTTYTKGQPTPPRGTRTNGGAPAATPTTPGARRPSTPPQAAPSGLAGRTRKARLRITKADPWSVMKVSFLLSVAIGIILIVASAVLWETLDSLGVFSSLGKTLKEVTGSGTDGSSGGLNIMDYIGFGTVLTYTSLIAVVDVVLLTALSTLAAFIYNTAAGFTGGIELTLAEED